MTQTELAGNVYQGQGIPAMYRLAREQSHPGRISKWLQKIVEQKPANADSERNPQKKEGDGRIRETPEQGVNSETELQQCPFEDIVLEETSRRRTLFYPTYEEYRLPPIIQIYRRQGAPSRWKWIVEPLIETGEKDSTQGLYEYLTATFVKNVENLQGKAGILLEW